MDFRVDTVAPCRKHVVITVPPERVQEEFDRQYEEINDNLALPGFRKGRAPRKLLEKRFSAQLVREVKEKLAQSALEKLVDDKQVEPLRSPELDLDALEIAPDAAFEIEFDVVTKPEFETPVWKDLELEVPAVVISDEALDEAVDRLRKSEATLLTVEDASVKAEDVLVVDWEAKDGDSVEAKDDNGYYLVGRGVLGGFVAEGLDEALEGKAPGAKADLKVHVGPDDPREELRGRDLDLHVTLKEVKRYVLPELDDAFLKRHDYDDVAEMRDDVRKQMERAHARERDRRAEDALVEKLLASVEFSLPEEFVESELENWARRRRVALEMENLEESDIVKRLDEERSDAQTAVETDMRRFFLLDRISEEEDVKVAEADILQAIQSIAQATGRSDEEVLTSFRSENRIAELASQLRHRKAGEVIRRAAKLVEVEASEAADAKPKAAKKKAAKKKVAKKKAAKKKPAKKDGDAPETDA